MMEQSVMDLSMIKHGIESLVSKNRDNMFGTLAGMWLMILNDVIDREGVRDMIDELDRAFYLAVESELVKAQDEKLKEAIKNGGEEEAKKYLAMLYMIKRKAEEGRR